MHRFVKLQEICAHKCIIMGLPPHYKLILGCDSLNLALILLNLMKDFTKSVNLRPYCVLECELECNFPLEMGAKPPFEPDYSSFLKLE